MVDPAQAQVVSPSQMLCVTPKWGTVYKATSTQIVVTDKASGIALAAVGTPVVVFLPTLNGAVVPNYVPDFGGTIVSVYGWGLDRGGNASYPATFTSINGIAAFNSTCQAPM